VPPVTIPEPPRNLASRKGDLWILGDHRLLCGDSTSCEDVSRLMKGERTVLFVTCRRSASVGSSATHTSSGRNPVA